MKSIFINQSIILKGLFKLLLIVTVIFYLNSCTSQGKMKSELYLDESMKDVQRDTSIKNGEALVKKGNKLELYANIVDGSITFYTVRNLDGDATAVIEIGVPTSMPDKKHPDPAPAPRPPHVPKPPVSTGCKLCEYYSDGTSVCIPVTCPGDPGPIRPK